MSVKQKIKEAKRNPKVKTLASNFAWLTALQFASYLFPFITMPYLARVIGVDGFGKISFASAVIVWVQTVAAWGFNYTATRDIAQNRENPQKVSEIFSNVLFARIILTTVSFLILLILIVTVPTFRESAAVILVTFLMIPGYICCPEWFFQAMERMKFITIINLLIKLFFTISIFIFIRDASDYILQPFLIACGYFLTGAFAFYIIIHKWGYRLIKPSWKEAIRLIKSNVDIFINNIMPNLYNSLSVVLLGFWGGPYANGILAAGQKLTGTACNFLGVISRTFFPFLSRSADKHKVYARFSMAITIATAAGIFIIAPWFIKVFFTEDFMDAVVVMRIMAVALVFLIMSEVYGTNYLIIHRKERLLRNITTIASVAGFLIAIPLVYYFQYIGAALTVMFTRGFLGFGYMFAARVLERKKAKSLCNS